MQALGRFLTTIIGLAFDCHPRTSEAQIRGSRYIMLDPRVKHEDDNKEEVLGSALRLSEDDKRDNTYGSNSST